jgi:aryl-alcohol dehydrogenase-like predicted oxidoreductase
LAFRCPVEKTGTSWVNRGDPAGIREDVEYALRELGVDYIDIIVLCRVPQNIPIEESVLGLKAMVDEGKARFIGISEASASTIRRAHAVSPLYCIEQEWSLWSRDIEESIVPTCRELGIKIIAYSPLGRGFLAGQLMDLEQSAMDAQDYRRTLPKVSGDNIQHNKRMVDAIAQFAQSKNCSVGQLALAWLHKQGDDVIPIPGTTQIPHLLENLQARDIALTDEDMRQVDQILAENDVRGDRYAHMAMTFRGNE